MEKSLEHYQARNLFFQTGLTNQQIADLLNINRNTITRWIKQEQWRDMKHAAMQAPGAVLLELYDQLTALNRNIASREPHLRFPTAEEAIIQRRLMMSIKATERQHPGNYMQTYSELVDELKMIEDPEFVKRVFKPIDDIIKRKIKRDTRFNTQQYMYLEDEVDENVPDHNTSLPLGEGQGGADATSCYIQKKDIPCDPQPFTINISTSMVQQNNLNDAAHNNTSFLDGEKDPCITITPPWGELEGAKIEEYKKLGYEKPTDNRSGLFFAQKKYGSITVKYGRVHPGRDPDMINYFDNLWLEQEAQGPISKSG